MDRVGLQRDVIAEAQSIDTNDDIKINVLGNTVFNNRNYVPFFAAKNLPQGAHKPFPDYGEASDNRIIDGSGVYLTRNNDHYKNGQYLVADNVTYGNGINGLVVHYTDRATVSNNTIANNGTVPLSAHRQRNSGLAVNHSAGLIVTNNRVQVNVAGDKAIKFFIPVTWKSSSGNLYCGGPSDLPVGATPTSVFWFGPNGHH